MSVLTAAYLGARNGALACVLIGVVSAPVVRYLAHFSVVGVYDEYCKSGVPPDVQAKRNSQLRTFTIYGVLGVTALSMVLVAVVSSVVKVAQEVLFH